MKSVILQLIEKSNSDDIYMRAAALSFYAALALAPLMIVIVAALNSLNIDVTQKLIYAIRDLIGEQAGNLFATVLNRSAEERWNAVGGVIGILGIILSIGMLFTHVQNSLNTIFNVGKDLPNDQLGPRIRHFVLRRLRSVGLLLFVFAVTFASMLIRAIEGGSGFLRIVGDYLVFACLFAAVFRWIPDRRGPNILFGGAITAFMFMVGKELIAMQISHAPAMSVYGAASSLAVLLLWVYYSSLIFFLGAEVSAVVLKT